MRPIELTMQAFGSYGKKTTVDFTVPQQNLFLVTGSTGSGKTTIFDAIVFALYGAASSSDKSARKGKEMQSQFADVGTTPFVELVFEEGNERYMIHRVPQHLRKKARGEGYTDQSASVSLILPDGREAPAKEADDRIRELIGLTKEQFMQVAMIAQGEFREVLRASSDDKKVIFRKLFGTEKFERIVEELTDRLRAQSTDLATIQTVCKNEASHIRIPATYGEAADDADDAGDFRAMLKELQKSDKFDITLISAIMEDLEALTAELQKQDKITRDQLAASEKENQVARDSVTKANELKQAYDSLEQAEKTLQQSREEQPMIQAKEQLRKDIASAYEIQSLHTRALEAGKLVRETEANIVDCQAKLPELREKSTQAKATAEEAAKEHQKALGNYSKIKERVDKAMTAFDEIQKNETLFQQISKLAANTAAKAESTRQALATFDSSVRQSREKEKELQNADLLLQKWDVQQSALKLASKQLQDVQDAETLLAERSREEEHAIEVYTKAMRDYEHANAGYQQQRKLFLNAQAGVLASQLEEGQPCPVCGSKDHPQPAMLGILAEALTQDILDDEERNVKKYADAQTKASSDAKAAIVRKEEQVKALQKNWDMLSTSFNALDLELPLEIDHESILHAEDALMNCKRQSDEAGDQIRQNAAELKVVREALEGADDRLSKLKHDAEEAQKRAISSSSEKDATEAALKQLRIGLEFKDREEAEAALKGADIALSASKKHSEDAQVEKAYTDANLQKTEARLAQNQEQLPAQKEAAEARQKEYEQILQKEAMDETSWQKVTADHQKSEVESLQSEINEYMNTKARAEGQLESAGKQIGDREKPDMESLQQRLAETEQLLQQHKAAAESVREDLSTNSTALGNLKQGLASREESAREYERVRRLRDALAGKVSGARMDIETYVQRYYLDRILYQANTRFLEMSGGQFELRMTDLEKAGTGKNRGLDLMVYSNVTGQTSEVGNLSGGESFMAALSLALGMADQIQESSSALNLDIMFIDEGFGSLDDRSREQAVRVLQEMAGGNKLIGIISHVTELKQEIDDQLVVTKDEAGSHLQWRAQ